MGIYYVIISTIVLVCYVTKTSALKCMTPSDARFVRPAYSTPLDWLSHGTHSGKYFPGPYARYEFSKSIYMFLTDKSSAATMWWTKVPKTNFYAILTEDGRHVLCTVMDSGLQVNWVEATTDTTETGYCMWDIEERGNGEMFRIRNAELEKHISEIQYVHLAWTGLHFDYNGSSVNDPSNAVDDRRTWWIWEKKEGQRDMTSLPSECPLGPSGEPLWLENEGAGIEGRSSTRRKRYPYRPRSRSSAPKVTCQDNWFLKGNKCYKIYSGPLLNHKIATLICDHFDGGKLVLPESRRENIMLSNFARKYAKAGSFWIRVTKKDSGQVRDEANDGPLRFTAWSRRTVRLASHDCAVLNSSSRTWNWRSCNAKSGKLLCERDVKPLEQPATCGKIQEIVIDQVMATAANTGKQRIVGGKNAELTQFPWQASIRFKTPITIPNYSGLVAHNCGGAILDKCWILTASHCFNFDGEKSHYIVRVGDLKKDTIEGPEQEFEIQTLIRHEQYTEFPAHQYDVALLQLQKKGGKCITFNKFIQPVCLPTIDFKIKQEGEYCQVSGWGVTDTSLGQASVPNTLQWVTVPTIRNSVCGRRYNRRSGRRYFKSDIMLCAGEKVGGKDSCSGDSGGPYVCRDQKTGRYAVAGIVSFGVGCAKSKYPGVYTRVTKFIPWITENMARHGGLQEIIRGQVP